MECLSKKIEILTSRVIKIEGLYDRMEEDSKEENNLKATLNLINSR